jgi:hypothetical protein
MSFLFHDCESECFHESVFGTSEFTTNGSHAAVPCCKQFLSPLDQQTYYLAMHVCELFVGNILHAFPPTNLLALIPFF